VAAWPAGARDLTGEERVAPVGARRLLRELDRQLLPPLARGLDLLASGRLRSRLLAVAALGSAAVVVIVAVWLGAGGQPATPEAGSVVRVGLTDGQTIPGYVESSRTKLARLLAEPAGGNTAADTYALVALKAYLAPDRLGPVLAGVAVAEVVGRVPLRDAQTEIVHIAVVNVPADVTAGMAQVAQRKAAEAAGFQVLSAKLTGGGGQERRLRVAYDSRARLALAEATAYQSHCSCLYAAVVRGTPAALAKVAVRPEVRAVDPAPEVHRLDRALFLPPLPEPPQPDQSQPDQSQPDQSQPARARPSPAADEASARAGRPSGGRPSAPGGAPQAGRRPTADPTVALPTPSSSPGAPEASDPPVPKGCDAPAPSPSGAGSPEPGQVPVGQVSRAPASVTRLGHATGARGKALGSGSSTRS
jgi:hypothetical protein